MLLRFRRRREEPPVVFQILNKTVIKLNHRPHTYLAPVVCTGAGLGWVWVCLFLDRKGRLPDTLQWFRIWLTLVCGETGKQDGSGFALLSFSQQDSCIRQTPRSEQGCLHALVRIWFCLASLFDLANNVDVQFHFIPRSRVPEVVAQVLVNVECTCE